MKHLFVFLPIFLLTLSALAQKKEKSAYERALKKIEFEDYEGALEDLGNAIESDSLDDEAFYRRGFVNAMLLKHQEALSDFDKAIKLNPKEPDYYSERGVAKLNLDNRKGACDDWKKAASMGSEVAKELADEYCP